MKNLRKPQFAQPGDTVGIYSPSSGIEPGLEANYERGKKLLLDRGYCLREATHTRDWKAHYSSEGRNKAADLMQLIHDPSVKVILPTVGGLQLINYFPTLILKPYASFRPRCYSDFLTTHYRLL